MDGALDTYWGRLRTCRALRSFQSTSRTGEDLATNHIYGASEPGVRLPDPGVARVPQKNGTRPEERREPDVLKGA